MERKRAASPTLVAVQPATKRTEWSGDDVNGPLSRTCYLPPKLRRGGRRSNKDGAAQLKRTSNVEAHSNHHQSVVRLSASNTRILRGTARCNACLKAGTYCSSMHPEVSIQESLFSIELPHNAHEVYMTAVENLNGYKVQTLALQAGYTRRPITDEELAECRKAFHRNEIGKLIVDLHGDADSLVWNTLNDVFRMSQDPRINTKERDVYQQIFRVWVLAHGSLVLERVSWEQWRQELLKAYDTLSQLILQNSTHSEFLFYRALFIWISLPLVTGNDLSSCLWQHLLELIEYYREMLPKQRGRRLPSSFRMAKLLNRHAAIGRLKRFKIKLDEEEWLELGEVGVAYRHMRQQFGCMRHSWHRVRL